MTMLAKILLRKTLVIETINDRLKNNCEAKHSLRRSIANFITYLVAGQITD